MISRLLHMTLFTHLTSPSLSTKRIIIPVIKAFVPRTISSALSGHLDHVVDLGRT